MRFESLSGRLEINFSMEEMIFPMEEIISSRERITFSRAFELISRPS